MVKKEPRASYFFSVPAVYPHSQYIFPQKQQLPFTPGGTHCPEPDVTLRDLTLSPGYHSDYAPQPIPEMDSSAVVPQLMKTPRLRKILPTTLRPEAIPDKRKRPETQDSHPFLKNVQECPGTSAVCHRVSTATEDCRSQRKADAHRASDKIYREIIWFCSGYLRKSGPEATRTIINSIFCEWASIFNDYSSPFRGVDSRDSEQCDWLWNAMQVRCGEPR